MGKDKNTRIMVVTDFLVLGGIALALTLILRADSAVFVGILGVLSILFFVLALCLRLRKQYGFEAAKKEVKKEMSEPLTLDYIKMRLEERNLNPQPFKDGDGFVFQSHGEWYQLQFSGDAILLLCTIEVQKDAVDAQELCNMVYSVDRSSLTSKVYMRDGEEGSDVLCVDNLCRVYMNSRDTFDRCFWEYQQQLARISAVLCENLGKMCSDSSNANDSRQDLYGIEYRWLPGLVHSVSTGQTPIEALTDEAWIRDIVQSKCPNEEIRIEWGNFKIKRVDNYGDYKLVIYEFPEPKFAPEAKYAAVLINTATLKADYYTLEKSLEDKWFYCAVTEKEHLNYGEAHHSDLDRFIEWVFSQNKAVEVASDWSKRGIATPPTSKNVN